MASISWITVVVLMIAAVIQIPTTNANRIRNCKDLRIGSENGIYTIYPYHGNPGKRVEVYCDMETDGGGWTVIQRRDNVLLPSGEREDFDRIWRDYKNGFGKLDGQFWLGNDHIHALTRQCPYTIRFDLTAWDHTTAWAKYSSFSISHENSGYRLKVSGYDGNAGNSFSDNNGMRFTTKDKDKDESEDNCAVLWPGAWWYNNCGRARLNGIYYTTPTKPTPGGRGVNWATWVAFDYSLMKTEMKIRPAN